MAARKNAPYRVYFVEAAGLDLIKIGYANNLETRFASLRTGSPVELKMLGSMPGGRDLERFFHRIFAPQRARGEWFRRCPELDGYIAAADKPYVPHPDAVPVIARSKRYEAYRTRLMNRRGKDPDHG